MGALAKTKRLGVLYGVGTGPGDPGLVTRKAWTVIANAAVIAYPVAAGSRRSIARHTVADAISAQAIEMPLHLPTKAAATSTTRDSAYDAACASLLAHLNHGRNVAVLCEGDGLLYGSLIPILTRLAKQVTTHIIPGIPAPMAAAATIQQPLATQNQCFLIVPATLPDAELAKAITAAESMAIIKLGRHAGRVRRLLDRLSLAENAHYIAHASLPQQHIAPLADMPSEAPYFSLILIHK